MERQKRILFREDPPDVWFIVDQLSLYRLAGSPKVVIMVRDTADRDGATLTFTAQAWREFTRRLL